MFHHFSLKSKPEMAAKKMNVVAVLNSPNRRGDFIEKENADNAQRQANIKTLVLLIFFLSLERRRRNQSSPQTQSAGQKYLKLNGLKIAIKAPPYPFESRRRDNKTKVVQWEYLTTSQGGERQKRLKDRFCLWLPREGAGKSKDSRKTGKLSNKNGRMREINFRNLGGKPN